MAEESLALLILLPLPPRPHSQSRGPLSGSHPQVSSLGNLARCFLEPFSLETNSNGPVMKEKC